jgi:glucose-1-phosphate thymidylyltransferase
MQAGIRDILIITTPHDQPVFQTLLGDGSAWGLNISWATQPSPDGLSQALIIAEDFLDGHPSVLILGDNLFYGDSFTRATREANQKEGGATVFGYEVKNPRAYGVVGFDDQQHVITLEEKPEQPASRYAVTGIYFYDKHAPAYAKQVTPSDRGELEITDLNRIYLDRGELDVVLLESGTTWLDTGTHRSLLKAAEFVSVIQERQGRRICCPEVIALRNGWISQDAFRGLAEALQKSGYGKYLMTLT